MSLQSKDPQENMTFKTTPLSTKTPFKSTLSYVTDYHKTRENVPETPPPPSFFGDVGEKEADMFAYQEDFLSDLSLLSGTVYDVDKIPKNSDRDKKLEAYGKNVNPKDESTIDLSLVSKDP